MARMARKAARAASWALLLAMAVAAHPGPAASQCTSPTLQLFLDRTIQVFRVGDFDPSDSHAHPDIFTVTICSDTARMVRLRLSVTSTAEGELADGGTDLFELPAGRTRLTNQDLTEQGGVHELRDFHVSPIADELNHTILETGRLPEGEYCFELELVDGTDGISIAPPARACLTVVNPLDLELLRPGAPFGETAPAAISLQPRFQWMSRAQCWRLQIAQVAPGDASGEDVMEHVPVYTTRLALSPGDCGGGPEEVAIGGAGVVSWNYQSAAEDLLPGQTYCWQVTSLIQTSGGPEEHASEVFCFRRWAQDGQDAERVASLLERLLRRLLERSGADVEGLRPTGDVWVNDQVVDPAALEEIVDGVISGRIRIEDLRIE